MRIRLWGAVLGISLSLSLAVAGPPAHAQQAPPSAASKAAISATVEQAERADKAAEKAAAEKNFRLAATKQEEAIALRASLVSKLEPNLAAAMVMVIAVDRRQAATYHLQAGDIPAAARNMEQAVAVFEKLPASNPMAKDLPQLKQALAAMRQEMNKSGAATSPPTSKAADPTDALIAKMKNVVDLYRANRTSEACAQLDSILPSVDSAKNLDEGIVGTVNMIAGRVYSESSQLAKAEARFKKALDYQERRYGRESPELLDVLTFYGDHFLSNREAERGVAYLVRAHDIAKARSSDKLGMIVLSLSRAVASRGDHDEAKALADKAKQIFLEQSGGKRDAVPVMFASMYIASIEEERNRFAEAERLYEEVKSDLEPLYRANPKDMAPLWMSFANGFGWHHRKRGNFAKAEAYMKESLAIRRQLYPSGSLAVADGECNLGEVYWASGDLERSLDPIQRCFDARDENVARVLATGSEEQKRAYLGAFLVAYEKTMTAQMRAGNTSPKMTRLGLGQVFRAKGRVLDAMSGESQAIRRGASTETRELLTRLATTRTLLAQASQSGRDVARVKQLEEESRSLEQKISEKSEAFRTATKPVSVQSVRAAIPGGQVLVEIVAFNPLDPQYKRLADKQGQRYLAYVLHGEGGPAEPSVVDLGPSAPIDEQARALRSALGDPDRDPSGPSRALYEAVVKPLEGLFAGKTKVILSPDGALNAVPFAALKKGDQYLVGSYTFTYVTSGRDLLRWNSGKPRNDSFVVVADPDFAMNGPVPPPGTRFANVKFPPLPGTEGEANALQKMFKSARLLTKRAATESAVKKVEHPQILHLATHGFFLKGEAVRMTTTRGLELDLGETAKSMAKSESPLLRSGLALAGAASLSGNDGEDGILTALEATSLDLVGTKLVVLSACQTAEGETQNGEGVYGLRRALSIAGAETLVMSLWSVDDEATSFLMRRYYERLKAGGGRSDSLRDVQLEMARSKAVSHPYFWAAFIPSGEPSSMDFPRDAPPSTSSPSSSSRPARDSSSSSSFLEDVGSHYDLPFMAGTFGFSKLALTPAAPGAQKLEGDALHVGFDINLISAFLDGAGIKGRSGFAFYDRASIALVGVNMGGEDLGANQLDYSAMLGYRTRFLGVFAGAMVGTGTLAYDDTLMVSGPFLPAAARVELPWWWGSRLTANAYAFKISGVREVSGVDARMPLFDPDFWLGVAYHNLRGRPEQAAEGSMLTFSLGIGQSIDR